jgi:hypothetical protein
MLEATRPAGLIYAQHRYDGVYHRADWRDRLCRSRSSESAVTLPESSRSPSPDYRSRSRNRRSRWIGILNGFLHEKNSPKCCNSIAGADGFLTGLVIGPNMIRRGSKQGFESIWGGKPPGIVSRGKLRHSPDGKMMNILGERLSLLSYQLEHERSQYEPLKFNSLDKSIARFARDALNNRSPIGVAAG